MIPASLFSSAHRSRRRRTPQQLADTRLDALAKTWTVQDRARLKRNEPSRLVRLAIESGRGFKTNLKSSQ